MIENFKRILTTPFLNDFKGAIFNDFCTLSLIYYNFMKKKIFSLIFISGILVELVK